jgi:anthranilate phosphoribosyltransferase
MTGAPQVTAGRSTYDGFRAVIKLVGTGPRGSRALTFEEARATTTALLRGEVSDVQASAFLMAMRWKGETAEELAGMAQAMRDAGEPLEGRVERPLVSCGCAYDGATAAPHLSVAAAALAAACGAGVVMHCGSRLGPKRGVTQADVLAALGGPAAPDGGRSARMLERSGATLVYTPAVLPGWERLARIRDQIGVRGPLHAAERLLAFFGTRRFVVAYTHSPYSERLLGALERLGAERAVTVRGIEGSDVLRPGRPSAHESSGPLELPDLPAGRVESEGTAEDSAALTRAVLAGEANGAAARAVTLSAGVRLYAAGLADDLRAATREAERARAERRGLATLEALVGS